MEEINKIETYSPLAGAGDRNFSATDPFTLPAAS
jgi:hypothetical protein